MVEFARLTRHFVFKIAVPSCVYFIKVSKRRIAREIMWRSPWSVELYIFGIKEVKYKQVFRRIWDESLTLRKNYGCNLVHNINKSSHPFVDIFLFFNLIPFQVIMRVVLFFTISVSLVVVNGRLNICLLF